MHSPAGDAITLRLHQALNQWQQWRCDPPLSSAPQLEGPLAGGLSNHNWLAASNSRQFVVRVDGVTPAHHGLNRQAEWRVLQTASAAGIAPAPRYFNPEAGVLVVDYHRPDATQTLTTDALASLLRTVHSLPRAHHRVDISERVRLYEQRVCRTSQAGYPAELQRAIQSTLDKVGQRDDPLVMTHNDLIPANLLLTRNRLLALDWEYCGMGSAWFDLAVASLGQDSNNIEPRALLAAYLAAAPSSDEYKTLRDFRVVARYLELLWHRSRSPASQHTALLKQHRPAIEQELY